MPLNKADVEQIAYLARLQLDEARIPELAGQLSSILEFVAQMDAADTSEVQAMAHPLDVSARLRDDVVTEGDQRDHFQSIAPQVENGLYLVPRVLE